ncbi:MAG: serine/threonine protein kinase [Labilithrix sp.]|nr:serine/threonine protein kinase [Labilithrix sp.]MCW5809975.1 serine/threonine protein kinase [Labilithrix sp.]
MAGPADDKPTKAPGSNPKGVTPRAHSSRPGGAQTVRPPARAAKGLIGQTISDRYKVERLLGEGGMGAVYQVEHVLMRKRMAVKVLHPEMTRLPEVVARFEREAMAAAHIEHPHVVAASDFGKLEDGSFFLALEYVEGKSLRDSIAAGRLDLGRALHIARQIAAALSRAHALKIVHRDLKPENVMLVDRDGDPDFVKVLDFGIAKVQIGELTAGDVEKSAPGPGQPVLTQAGMVYGTPEYMAPEQALGQPVDARADLYALGIIMYEMLCGVRPFNAESKVALLGMQVTAPMPPMNTKAPDANIPEDVEHLVKRLLAKEANERLGDAKELIEELSAMMRELVNSGSIDIAYASQPGGRLGTNPNIISGFGPAVDVPGAIPSSKPRLRDRESDRNLANGTKETDPKFAGAAALADPVGFLGGKAWMIAAAGGLIGILVLVITIVVVLKSGAPKDADDASTGLVATPGDAGKIAEPTIDERVAAAKAEIDKGNYGSGIEALQSLPPDAQNREDVHKALFKAYSQTDKPREAMREVGLVMKANPSFDLRGPEGVTLRQEVRNTALLWGQPSANKGAVDDAWALLDGELGAIGFDDLYDIGYGQSGVNYPKAVERAKADLAKADKSKMSPALAITVELHAAEKVNNCMAIRGMLDRAVERGDERTLYVFKTLAPPRFVGHFRPKDMLGCIHEGSLVKATTDLEARLKKK